MIKKISTYVEPAERAVQYIIHHPKSTYASVAKRFGVPTNKIRGRIEHRFGSLAHARASNGVQHIPRVYDRVKRVCFVCKVEAQMYPEHRVCDSCKTRINSMHDWNE